MNPFITAHCKPLRRQWLALCNLRRWFGHGDEPYPARSEMRSQGGVDPRPRCYNTVGQSDCRILIYGGCSSVWQSRNDHRASVRIRPATYYFMVAAGRVARNLGDDPNDTKTCA